MRTLFLVFFVILFTANNSYSVTIILKVKDFCEPKTDAKCTLGKKGNMNGSVADYKHKAGTTTDLVPSDLNVSNFTDYNHFYIPNPDNCSIGLGVVNGLMYTPLNPNEPFYYWIYDTSTQYNNYDDWKNAVEIIESTSAPSNCSIIN